MTALSYRPATQEELPQIVGLLRYAFTEEGATAENEYLLPEWTRCAFAGKRLAACSAIMPLQIRLNGKPVDAAGITAVAVDPGWRRQGLIRQLITQSLHQQREAGVPLAILWATVAAVYQRFGFGLATQHIRYSFDPRLAVFAGGETVTGRMRRLTKAEGLPLVRPIYQEYIAHRNLMLQRPELIWQRMMPDREKSHYSIAVHFDAANTADAYAIYSTQRLPDASRGPFQSMTVSDLCWLTPEGYRAIWEYLCGHDLVHRIDWIGVPEDDPAPGLLREPRVLQRSTIDGVWMRVLDAAKALGSRGYPNRGEVVLEVVDDELCPWNNGFFQLHSDGEACRVRSLGPGTEADIRLRSEALASLLSGQYSASWLARIGRLQARRPERLRDIDFFFSTAYRPCLANDF